jgi:hypothetical protein
MCSRDVAAFSSAPTASNVSRDLLRVLGTRALEEQVPVEMRDAARSSRSSRAQRGPTPVRNLSATEQTFGAFSDTLRY